jgi:hypothetical protein
MMPIHYWTISGLARFGEMGEGSLFLPCFLTTLVYDARTFMARRIAI